jgi:hypothetical protein
MIGYPDFAADLRQMAAHAEQLAERQDVASVAELRRDLQQRNDQVDRDGDLIAELRRQVEVMGRSLDGIGRMRKGTLAGDQAAVQILTDALLIIAGDRCAAFTSGSCRSVGAGKTRGAPYGADAWCEQCVARDALERAGAVVSS